MMEVFRPAWFLFRNHIMSECLAAASSGGFCGRAAAQRSWQHKCEGELWGRRRRNILSADLSQLDKCLDKMSNPPVTATSEQDSSSLLKWVCNADKTVRRGINWALRACVLHFKIIHNITFVTKALSSNCWVHLVSSVAQYKERKWATKNVQSLENLTELCTAESCSCSCLRTSVCESVKASSYKGNAGCGTFVMNCFTLIASASHTSALFVVLSLKCSHLQLPTRSRQHFLHASSIYICQHFLSQS